MHVCVQLHVTAEITVQEICFVRNTDMKYADTKAQESFGINKIQCHCKSKGLRQGSEQEFMIYMKISNGFLSCHTRFKEGQSYY